MKRSVQKLKSNLGHVKDCTSVTLLLGIHAYRRKQWSKAQAYLENACEKHSSNSLAHYKLGMCHFKKKDWELAATCMAKALELSPNQVRWRIQYLDTLSKQAIRGKKWLAAETNLQELIAINIQAEAKENARMHKLLAEILRRQGKWWQVVEALKTAIELDAHHAEWWYELGEAEERMNRFQSAATRFGKAIQLKGNEAEAQWHYRQGYCYEREGHDGAANLQAAKEAYELALTKDTKLNAKRYGIGVFHQARGHWPQAAAAYQQQLKKAFWDAELHYRLGMAHDRCYEWAEAEDCYIKALTLDKNQPYWHYRLGFVLERQEKHEQAALAYQYAAINHDKHTPYWFYRWGYVLEQQGDFQAAAEAFLQTQQQTALDRPPEQLNEVCDEQFTSQQFLIKNLGQFLEEDTTNPEIWYKLGNCYEREENWQGAVEAYKHALARQNDHTPEWFYCLGYVLTKAGQYQQACEVFRQLEAQQEFTGVTNQSFLTPLALIDAHYLNACRNLDLQNIALFESFGGLSFTCNPYAIFKKMAKDPQFKDWVFVIVSEDASSYLSKRFKNNNIILIKKGTYLYSQYLAVARILINNATFPIYFIKREGQIYVNTWHGTPWKTLGNDNPMQNGNTARNFIHADFLLSPNSHTSKILIERYGIDELFNGELLESGYPRIDLLVNASEKIQQKLINQLFLTEEKPIVLYAPTYRGLWSNPDIEADMLVQTLMAIQSPDYQLVFRGHYFTEEKIKALYLDITIAESSIDSCELLSIVDVLITDYSSILFDFLIMQKPILLYIPDLSEYVTQRGLYLEPDQVPGCSVYNLPELKDQIRQAIQHPAPLTEELAQFLPVYAPHEDGKASERVIKRIKSALNKPLNITKQENNATTIRTLLHPGAIYSLEDVERLQGYISENFKSAEELTLILNKNQLVQNQEIRKAIEGIPQVKARIEYSGRMIGTPDERWISYKHINENYNPSEQTNDAIRNIYKQEYKRLLGNNQFDNFVNLEKSSQFWIELFNKHPPFKYL